MNDDLHEAVERLRRAVNDAGPVPEIHHRVMRKHRKQWPTLWNAIDDVLRAAPSIQEPEHG